MKSRERVKAVLNHRQPDRVPIDLGGTRGTGIAALAYIRTRQFLDLAADKVRMYDFIQHLSYPDQDFIERFHIDVIDAGQAFPDVFSPGKSYQLDNGSSVTIPAFLNLAAASDGTVHLKDQQGLILGSKPPSSKYVDQCYWIYGDKPSIPEIIHVKDLTQHLWAVPAPPWHLDLSVESDHRSFVEGIRRLYESSNLALALTVGCSLFEGGQYLRGFENFLCDVYADRKGTIRLLERLVELYMKRLELVLRGAGKYLETVRFTDDLGSQDRALIGCEKYREIFKPFHKRLWNYVHDHSDCKVTLHSCGAVSDFIPDLLDAGLDILNPVQTTAKGMDPTWLKREYGKDLVFWGGGCDTQRVLSFGTPREVQDDVRKRVRTLGRDGGLVFAQIHNIQADVPPENIVAMLTAASESGSK